MEDLGPRPYDPTRDEVEAPAPAAPASIPEKWAFESRTIQRLCVAGIMYLISTKFAAIAPFIDQQTVADAVKMLFDLAVPVFLGAAARAKQIGDVEPPVKLYWIPRSKQQKAGLALAA